MISERSFNMEYEFSQKWTKEDYVAFATNHLFLNFLKIQNIVLYSVSIGYLLITPIMTDRWEFFYVGIGLIVLMGGFFVLARRELHSGQVLSIGLSHKAKSHFGKRLQP